VARAQLRSSVTFLPLKTWLKSFPGWGPASGGCIDPGGYRYGYNDENEAGEGGGEVKLRNKGPWWRGKSLPKVVRATTYQWSVDKM